MDLAVPASVPTVSFRTHRIPPLDAGLHPSYGAAMHNFYVYQRYKEQYLNVKSKAAGLLISSNSSVARWALSPGRRPELGVTTQPF